MQPIEGAFVAYEFKHFLNRVICVFMEKICLNPIGYAKNSEKELRFGSFSGGITEIILDEKLTDSLIGIEDYSHVIIVYWMDKVRESVIKHRPQGNPKVPIVGIFSCRCPQRPNPIAITTVELLGREGNKIKVKGLDIIDGTPIIDIKPYWPQYDKVENEKIPDWVSELDI